MSAGCDKRCQALPCLGDQGRRTDVEATTGKGARDARQDSRLVLDEAVKDVAGGRGERGRHQLRSHDDERRATPTRDAEDASTHRL